MPAELLTNTELDELLTQFVYSLPLAPNTPNYAMFITLYDHGFRVSELRHLQDWVINASDQVEAPTLKGGNVRTIPIGELHALVLQSIYDSTNYVYFSSYDYYKNYFKREISVKDLTVGEKSVSTHAFRHNRIKQLSNEGMTVEQIRVHMGISQTSTVTGYLNSQVYKHT